MNTLYIIFELDQLITILVYILQLLQELEQMLIIAIWSSFMRLPFKFAPTRWRIRGGCARTTRSRGN